LDAISNEYSTLESKIERDLFALDLVLLLDYGYLIRHMLKRKKKMKYDEITNQIQQIQGTKDRARILKLVAERDVLKYQPNEGMLSIEDLQTRGQDLLNRLSEEKVCCW